MKFKFKIKTKDFILLGSLILLLILLRIPTLFEPHWQQDEGFYASVAHSLSQNLDLYKDVFFDKMPGILSIYQIVSFTDSFYLITLKIVAILAAIASLISIFKIAETLFNREVAILSSLISILFLGLPIINSNIVSIELISLPFCLAAYYIFLSRKEKLYLLMVVLLGIALLFSPVYIFNILALLTILWLSPISRTNKPKRTVVMIVIGVLLPILFFLSYLYLSEVNTYFFDQVILTMKSDVFSSSEDSIGFILFKNTFISRSIFLILSIAIINTYYVKKKVKQESFYLFIWGIFSSFILLLTNENRLEYLLHVVPLFSITSAVLLYRLFTKKTFLATFQMIFNFLLVIFLILNLFSTGKKLEADLKSYNYYINAFKYMTKNIDLSRYIAFFGEDSSGLYKLNSYLAQKFPNEQNILILTNNTWIYKLADIKVPTNYIVEKEAYENMEILLEDISRTPPQVIIIDQDDKNEQLMIYLEKEQYQLDINLYSYSIYSLSGKK